MEVDVARKRVSFTMRMDDTPGKPANKPQGKPTKHAGKAGKQGQRSHSPKQGSVGNSAMGNAFADAFAKAKNK